MSFTKGAAARYLKGLERIVSRSLDQKLETLNPKPETLNPIPEALKP